MEPFFRFDSKSQVMFAINRKKVKLFFQYKMSKKLLADQLLSA